MVRAITSVAPPGGNDTTIRIGRLGKDCALATLAAEHSAAIRATDSRTRLVVIVSSAVSFVIPGRPGNSSRVYYRRDPWIPDSLIYPQLPE